MKAMILAAGKGTRMGSVSRLIPKPLTKLNKSTLIELNIMRLRKSGIKEVVINVSWLGKLIKSHLGDGEKYDVKITYSEEGSNILGTGGGIYNALKFLGNKPFWLINADLFTNYKIDAKKKIRDNALCHLILVENPNHNKLGDFDLDKGNVIFNKFKKYTFSGISIISPKLFDNMKNKKKFALEPLLRNAAKSGKVTGEVYRGKWIDVGTRFRLRKAIKK